MENRCKDCIYKGYSELYNKIGLYYKGVENDN